MSDDDKQQPQEPVAPYWERSTRPIAPQPAKKPETFGDIEEVEEVGGREGPDPTRFGDWEKQGRCIDF